MRPATRDDLEHITGLLERFHEVSGQPFAFNPDAVSGAVEGMMADGCVLVSERGVIGGILGRAWADPEWVYACELFWWAEDGSGARLLRGFEEWAREAGAREVRMTSLAHLGRAGRLLEARGYTLQELSFGKAL